MPVTSDVSNMRVPQHVQRGLYFVIVALCLDVVITSLTFFLMDILPAVMALARYATSPT
jgi:hypothetical protein